MAEEGCELELTLNRFGRLIDEVLRGETRRNSFQPWEIDLLLDMESCALDARRREKILRQYRRAAEKQMDYGVLPPLKLSEYLAAKELTPDTCGNTPEPA
jgi:hypothetical protein